MRIDMVSEHASPLAALGSVDAGGQNVYVLELSSALAALGHEVRVWTRREDTVTPEVVVARPGVTVRPVPAGPPVVVGKDELVPYLPAFADHLRDAWAARPPDLVHAHFWMSGMVALAAARPVGVPVVQTFHALGSVTRRHQDGADTSPAGRIAAEQAVGRRADRILASCTDEVFELVRLGVPRRRTIVVPCGVDTEEFSPHGPVAQRTDRPRLVSIGGLARRKGVDEAVEALRRVPDAELVIAGGTDAGPDHDPDAQRLRRCAEANGVADRVRLLGPVPHPEVPALLRSADAVTCVPWYEPFGMVPLEAMACGRPVVGTAVGGLTDTVVDGVTGILVPPRDPRAVAAALREVLGSRTRAMALGIAGRDRVLARYGWARVAESCAHVYRDVLDARPDSGRAVVVGAGR